jgi:hypothetical protein
VTFELHGNPGSHGRLLYSAAAANPPTVFPGVGMLYLDRFSVHSVTMGNLDATGTATATFPVTGNPGSTQYFQGFTTSPRALTQDWVKVTVLP